MAENNQMMSVEGQLVGMPLAGPESFSQQQLDYLKRALGVDETVLWSGTASSLTNVTLSETLSNFERARIIFNPYISSATMSMEIKEFLPEDGKKILCLSQFITSNKLNLFKTIISYTGTTLTIESQYYFDGTWSAADNHTNFQLYKVIGIHRIAGGNQ